MQGSSVSQSLYFFSKSTSIIHMETQLLNKPIPYNAGKRIQSFLDFLELACWY